MRITFTLATILVAAALMTNPAYAQTCGNVNGDSRNNVDLGDLAYLMAYLGGIAPTPSNPAMADLDGRAGISIGDAVYFVRYLFGAGPAPDCSQSNVYSWTILNGDTLFWPSMLYVPDGIDSVSLPVTMALGSRSDGLYLPVLKIGPGANAVFQYSSITADETSQSPILSADGLGIMDTVVFEILYKPTKPFTPGRRTSFSMNFIRQTPGTGIIAPQLVDRGGAWKPSYEVASDLHLPFVVPVDVTLPPETLKTVPTQLTYTAMAGRVASDSFLVSFSSTGIPISFTLTASDPWIILKDVPPAGLTTPASIWVKADASALPIGSYNGTITMTPTVAGTPKSPDVVNVSFTVTTPIIYPPGDFNCDGIADAVDLSIFISYLTGGGATVKDCNH